MKIAVIYGAMPNYDGELSRVLKVVSDTLAELEVELVDVNLAYTQIPYFDGIGSAAAEDIMHGLEAADGVIFATTAVLYGISAVMSAFMEYFMLSEYEDTLRGKNCMVVVTGHVGDGRSVLESFSRVLNRLGASDAVRMALSPTLAQTLDADTRDIITKQAEDFYRIVRQSRKFFVLTDSGFRTPTIVTPVDGLSQSQYETLQQMEKRQKLELSEVYERLNLSAMTSKQEQDIDEITQVLSQKYTEPRERKPNVVLQAPKSEKAKVVPRAKTCKQMTQTMPHYFQPQMAAGFAAEIQINVSGSEKFEGYLQILNAECQYVEGVSAAPDITILADSAVWIDVLTGKSSAQKAFMIGKLKVRGNFVILTKLEQLFKPMT